MESKPKRAGDLSLPVRAQCRPQRPFTFDPRDLRMVPNDFGVMPDRGPDPWHYVICCFASEVNDAKLDAILMTHTIDHSHNCIFGISACDWRLRQWADKHRENCIYLPLTHFNPGSLDLTWDDMDGQRERIEGVMYALMSGFFGRSAEVVIVGDTTRQGTPIISEVARALPRMAKGWGIRRVTHVDDDATDEITRAAGEMYAWERDYKDMQRRIRAEIAAADAAEAAKHPVCLGEAIASDMAPKVRVADGAETFRHADGAWRVDDLDPNEGRHRELTRDELRALMTRPLRGRRKSDDGLVTYFV